VNVSKEIDPHSGILPLCSNPSWIVPGFSRSAGSRLYERRIPHRVGTVFPNKADEAFLRLRNFRPCFFEPGA
jgi:hypothetical protein